MRVELFFGIPEESCENVIVIDVFRSSTTIILALENGAKEVIPTGSPEEAKKVKERIGDGLLVGEELGFTPEGFDMNISPRLMTKEAVSGRRMIYCSTNLMKAVLRFMDAENLIVGALTNSSAVARYVNSLNPSRLMIVACGFIPKKMITLEDVVGAGSIISKLRYDEASDTAIMARLIYENENWKEAVREGFIANYLRKIGWGDDIDVCLEEDLSNIVPVLREGSFKGVRA